MRMIVAVDRNWGIGYRGELLARVRADMRRFASLTTGGVVILGSKTLATFPGGRPLKNRTNIILSRREDFSPEGAVIVRSIEELLCELKKYADDSVFVIGGTSVYELLLPYCDYAYVTEFDKEFIADSHITNLDKSPDWELVYCGCDQTSDPETDSEGEMVYRFKEYRRKNPITDNTIMH